MKTYLLPALAATLLVAGTQFASAQSTSDSNSSPAVSQAAANSTDLRPGGMAGLPKSFGERVADALGLHSTNKDATTRVAQASNH
ncbi:MAG TPA: hypothetical protein VGF97_11235 [Rhizomicrobium sp.]|jgi:hypothetical protein